MQGVKLMRKKTARTEKTQARQRKEEGVRRTNSGRGERPRKWGARKEKSIKVKLRRLRPEIKKRLVGNHAKRHKRRDSSPWGQFSKRDCDRGENFKRKVFYF